MKILFSLLVGALLTGATCGSQGKDKRQDWIDNLKQTSVSRLEAGLPEAPFDGWLSELVQSAQLDYRYTSCDSADSSSGQCIIVSADVASGRRVELTFAVPSQSIANPGEAACSFVRGAIGPADPRSKQPTRLIRKLSELAALLR